ncbi:uncharacterized protein LOC132730996 [Ruditapes philippinarum]|uniref:uncharacterized protein LOC132730996 n=1 Tax=Ruditapes philippinarum TaxID=129788 RepID=UPI00295ADB4E|nr:uncharacterized protein LOC132730996 [Ruditapes philippinarum]
MWIYTVLLQLYFTLLELTNCLQIPDVTDSIQNKCCNGILGYARPFEYMPCNEMKCCNDTETVALQKVNHALGFCFRCVAQTTPVGCYSLGQEVASTNDTTMDYKLRTCCSGLKFKVFTYLNDVAMTIKCVHR